MSIRYCSHERYILLLISIRFENSGRLVSTGQRPEYLHVDKAFVCLQLHRVVGTSDNLRRDAHDFKLIILLPCLSFALSLQRMEHGGLISISLAHRRVTTDYSHSLIVHLSLADGDRCLRLHFMAVRIDLEFCIFVLIAVEDLHRCFERIIRLLAARLDDLRSFDLDPTSNSDQ